MYGSAVAVIAYIGQVSKSYLHKCEISMTFDLAPVQNPADPTKGQGTRSGQLEHHTEDGHLCDAGGATLQGDGPKNSYTVYHLPL